MSYVLLTRKIDKMKRYSAAIIVLILFALTGCKEHEKSAVTVEVVRVAKTSSTYTRSYLGTVTAYDIHLMLSTYGGTVTTLNAKVGQRVTKGQLLAVIDAPDVKSLNKANMATLRQARDGYERAKKVYEGGGLSEIKWMEVQTQLAQAESAAEISQHSLDECQIKSPFTGTIDEVFVTLGKEITPGSRIATIIDESTLEVSIDIPEGEYSTVKKGDKAEVVIPALDELRLTATVNDIGVRSTSITHSYTAKLVIDNYPADLKAGMACKVYLRSDLQERLAVPASVVKTDDEGRYVWVIDSEGIVSKRRVVTMGFIEKGVAIQEGLVPDDLVIVEGISKVSSGMKVKYTERR